MGKRTVCTSVSRTVESQVLVWIRAVDVEPDSGGRCSCSSEGLNWPEMGTDKTYEVECASGPVYLFVGKSRWTFAT